MKSIRAFSRLEAENKNSSLDVNLIHNDQPTQELITSKQNVAMCLNSQRRLVVSQFRHCWEKYSPHLAPNFILTRLVETGEEILGIEGFYDVADALCFTLYLDKAGHRIDSSSTIREEEEHMYGDEDDFESGDSISFIEKMEDHEIESNTNIVRVSQNDRGQKEIMGTSQDSTSETTPVRGGSEEMDTSEKAKTNSSNGSVIVLDNKTSLKLDSESDLKSNASIISSSSPNSNLTSGRKTSSADARNSTSIPSSGSLKNQNIQRQIHSPLQMKKRTSRIPRASPSSPVSLTKRCLYGKELCKYLHLLKVDSTLRSPPARNGVQNVLANIIDIMSSCGIVEKDGGFLNLEWLLFNGTFHIRTITDKLFDSGHKWPEVKF